MSYTTPTPEDLTFNAVYVELVTLGRHSVTDMLDELARNHRQTGAIYADEGNTLLATAFKSSGAAYEQALAMLELVWNQAMERVARQVTA